MSPFVRTWLGPGIVLVGAAVAGLGAWYFVHAAPKPGGVIDTIAIDGQTAIVVRAEDGGERSFVELRERDDVKWQALIPHYAGGPGRPAIAWGANSLTVRVERDGRAEVFAFALSNAVKIGGYRLAPEHEPIRVEPQGPITLTDHIRAYEIVGGANWHQMIAVDLRSGKGLWKCELGATPISAGSVDHGKIELQQGGRRRMFDVFTGVDVTNAL